MQLIEGQTLYSASDLNNFLQCHYLTELDRLVAGGALTRPEKDPSTELIAQKGLAHEARYLQRLRDDGLDVIELPDTQERTIAAYKAAAALTALEMETGKRVIYQPTFFDGTFVGRADFLMRVDEPSGKWPWSYEPVDTKLALHSKPYFIIQLCHYAEQIEAVQGSRPKQLHVVLGDGSQDSYKVNDFFAYYTYLREAFLKYAAEQHADAYPVKNEHCGICTWSERCEKQRRSDDHLILVAGMRTDMVRRFNAAGIMTVAQLADASDEQRPERMGHHTFKRLRRQAQLQMHQRATGTPTYELQQHEPWEGFGLMPPPAKGDVFFDMEGDPLYDIGKGLEYLFGMWLPDDATKFKAFWGTDRAGEKRAFEQFVDFIVERRKHYPTMHVYHYADYEKSALRRLAQRHATREEEVDELLKGEVLVDLYAVVRRALLISQESYSIKKFEIFYGLKRAADVKKGDDSIVQFERWLDDRSQTHILEQIERYNEEDCESTVLLRDWLVERKAEAEREFGAAIAFRQPVRPNELGKYEPPPCHAPPVEGCKKCANRLKKEREEAKTSLLQRQLLEGIVAPENEHEFAQMDETLRARYLLGNLLSYHRREAKPVFWEFFDRCNKVDDLVEFDKHCLGGLELVESYKDDKNRTIATYTFPEQHYELNGGNLVDPIRRDPSSSVGKLVGEIDDENRRITLRLAKYYDANPSQLRAIAPFDYIYPDPQQKAAARVAEAYAGGSLQRGFPATLDLLMARTPRLTDRSSGATIQPTDMQAETIYGIVRNLDRSYLFLQGPPGTGKTTKGGEIIARLLRDGYRIGVMSNSHKAVHNLLDKIEEASHRLGVAFKGFHKSSDTNEGSEFKGRYGFVESLDDGTGATSDAYQLVSGTTFLFTREALASSFDFLFIDEAGQIALADALGSSLAARNVVLLGDPMQLAHVSQGSHPYRCGASILEHLLDEAKTVGEDRGVFLTVTHRLHPELCRFISDSFYDSRLEPGDTSQQRIGSAYPPGLKYITCTHDGNARQSHEEARAVVEAVRLLRESPITEADGTVRAATDDDIVVVTPYNAQRRLITRYLKAINSGVRVGTVDKFQGQEGYAVIYSMVNSSTDALPRGLSFILDENRINVALSRSRVSALVVGSPQLAEGRPRSLHDIRLMALLCEIIKGAASDVHLRSGAA